MRRELGVEKGVDILTHTASLQGNERIAAEQLIKRIEDEAMLGIEIQPGLDELITYLESAQLPKAILTRNNPDTVAHFLSLREPAHKFEILVTREFQPPKPAPDPLLHIAKTWNVRPDELLMVGDHLDDLHCAKNAGAVSILVNNDGNSDFIPLADHAVDRLDDIINLLRSGLEVERVDTE
ncbi:HAD-like domain-containing protein [Syncephalis fuscata]|nr:HAD-like domain-containing protein [Syncephalis fuscata]